MNESYAQLLRTFSFTKEGGEVALQRVTVAIPENMVAAADALVQKEGRSRSSILREAIEGYLREREERDMIAEYAEAADLNLALAEEHMEAFDEISAAGI